MRTVESRPLVSAIIPAFNEGPMLAAAIDSALRQTYSHVEIIVVNDGSTSDVTRRTVERYLQSHPARVKYFERQENGGVAAARNTGIAAAKGDMIAWLDQDDRWLPDRVARGVAALERHPHVGIVHGSYFYINSNGERTGKMRLKEREYAPLPELLLDIDISPCTVIFRRRLLDEVGYLDAGLPGADDWLWALILAAEGYRFYSIEEPLAEYRLHVGNTFRRLEVMVPSWLGMLDKFYAQPNLPEVVLRYRNRAYFQRHAAAAANYYGSGALNTARHHLGAAIRYYPKGVATARMLQSLVYSREEQPSMATAREAAEFVAKSLRGAQVPARLARTAQARGSLVLALHAGPSKPAQALRLMLGALAAEPQLVLDGELWAAARRLASRATCRSRAPARRIHPGPRTTLE